MTPCWNDMGQNTGYMESPSHHLLLSLCPRHLSRSICLPGSVFLVPNMVPRHTSTCTERHRLQETQAGTHRHVSTHLLSLTLRSSPDLHSGLFPLSPHPPPQKSPPHTAGRPVRTPGKLPWAPSKAKGRSRGGKQRVLPQQPWSISLPRLKTSSSLWPGAGKMTQVE